MAFWTQAGNAPKRNYRFRVYITGAGTAGPAIWWAKTVTLPSFEISEVEHNYFDKKFYYPGSISWNDVTMTLVDPVSPDASLITAALLVGQGYQIPDSDANQVQTISKIASVSSGLKAVYIEVLTHDNMVVEEWKLNNPFVKSAKWGDLDYSNDELKQIDMVIRYDWASLEGSAVNSSSGGAGNAGTVPTSSPEAFSVQSTWNAAQAESIVTSAVSEMPTNPNAGSPSTSEGEDNSGNG